MFTKQYYKAIAEIIVKNTHYHQFYCSTPKSNFVYHKELVKDLADYFAANNPQFDRQKFLDTCGIEG